MTLGLSRLIRSSPYRPVLGHRILRRLLPGFTVSALGDGMAVVAVGWLAIQLAPAADRGVWVAVAVAAYTLPGALGTLVLGRFLRHRSPRQLACWDSTLRACALGAIPVAYAFGALNIGVYIALLAVSSVLHSWGQAGVYTVIARILPERDHLAGNALLTAIGSFTTVAGPVLAGLIIAWGGAATVVAADATSFAVLAVTFRFAIPADAVQAEPLPDDASRASGFDAIRGSRTLLGLLSLSFGYFFLFGPVYVALPVHVVTDLHGSASVLAAYYAAFGVGAVVGALLAGFLGRWPALPTAVGIVIAFGAVLLLVGRGTPEAGAMIAFGVAGLLWPPYSSLSMTLFQKSTTASLLPEVLAALSAARVLSVPLGTVLGGPLVAAFGAATTLQISAGGILVLGLVAAGAVAFRGKPAISG